MTRRDRTVELRWRASPLTRAIATCAGVVAGCRADRLTVAAHCVRRAAARCAVLDRLAAAGADSPCARRSPVCSAASRPSRPSVTVWATAEPADVAGRRWRSPASNGHATGLRARRSRRTADADRRGATGGAAIRSAPRSTSSRRGGLLTGTGHRRRRRRVRVSARRHRNPRPSRGPSCSTGWAPT